MQERRAPLQEGESRPSPVRGQDFWLATLGLLALAIGVHLPAISGPFVWDDTEFFDPLAPTVPSTLVQADDGLARIWFSTEPTDYWPLTYSVFWLEWRLFGMEPAGYHVVSILLHALATCLLWRVFLRLKVPGAWVAAAIFAVHPLGTTSVAWIVETKNTLSLALCSASLLLYLVFVTERRRAAFGAALVCFALGLAAKTSGVMLPVVFQACVWWLNGRVRRADVVSALPFFALSLAMGLATIWFQHHQTIGDDIVRAEGLASRVAATGWILWFYAIKSLAPFDLALIYPRWDVDPSRWLSWLPLAALVALTVVAIRFRARRWRGALFALGAYATLLFPVVGLVDMSFMRYSLVADHFAYLALPVVAAACTALVGSLLASWNGPRQQVAVAASVLVLCVGSIQSWRRSATFQDRVDLWNASLAANPDAWLARYNLAVALRDEGRTGEALSAFRETLEMNPDYAPAHHNVGLLLQRSSDSAGAVEHYRRALEIDPDLWATHANLGFVLVGEGKRELALPHYEAVVRLRPELPVARFELGRLLERLGRPEDAAAQFRIALDLAANGHELEASIAGSMRGWLADHEKRRQP